MNAIKIYNLYNMKISCRFLTQSRTVLGTIKFPNPNPNRNIHIPPPRFVGLRCAINHTHKPYIASSPYWGKSWVFPAICCSSSSSKNSSSKPNYVVDYSTTLETHVNDKNSKSVYVQGGGDLDENGVKNVGNENERVESEWNAEKEVWRLFREAVITYCGTPVGTLAANDPGDKVPLNDDQVFIRDFVPSALVFSLKGEGEIVRNILLHTL